MINYKLPLNKQDISAKTKNKQTKTPTVVEELTGNYKSKNIIEILKKFTVSAQQQNEDDRERNQ